MYYKINLFCYNYTKKQIDFLLKTNYFFHDNEQEINKGEIISIIGKNAAGKSTILNLIGGVLLCIPERNIEKSGDSIPVLSDTY